MQSREQKTVMLEMRENKPAVAQDIVGTEVEAAGQGAAQRLVSAIQ